MADSRKEERGLHYEKKNNDFAEYTIGFDTCIFSMQQKG